MAALHPLTPPPYRGISCPPPTRSPSPSKQTLHQWRPNHTRPHADRISPQHLREQMTNAQTSKVGRSLAKASKLLGAEAHVLLHPQPLSFPHPMIEYNPLLTARMQEAAQPHELRQRRRGAKPYCTYRAPQRCRRSGVLFEGRACNCDVQHERRLAREWEETPCERAELGEAERTGGAFRETKVKFVLGEVSEVKVVERWIQGVEYPESEDVDVVEYAEAFGLDAEEQVTWAEVTKGEGESAPFVEDEEDWLGDQGRQIAASRLVAQGLVDGVGTIDLGLS